MEEVVAIDEITGGEVLLHDVLAANQEDPATTAARNLDWQQLCGELGPREKSIISLMVQGNSGSAMARKLRVSESAIQTGKKNLALKILEYMGINILVDIQRRPGWKDNLDASRERLACKHERCGH
jgi:FixJ family two-component response regulator